MERLFNHISKQTVIPQIGIIFQHDAMLTHLPEESEPEQEIIHAAHIITEEGGQFTPVNEEGNIIIIVPDPKFMFLKENKK